MQDRTLGESPPAARGIPTPRGSRFLPRVDFRVLGPIEVVGPDGSVPLGGPKQRAVLAHLLVRANALVTTEALIDAVWPDEPPEAPKASLRAYVSNLRKAIGPTRIESRAPGYLLRVDPDEVDEMRFEALVRDARRISDDPTRAASLFHDALTLWRGPAFADLDGLRSLDGEIARLDELRLAATEEQVAAELAAGRHDELLGELDVLVHEHPLRERMWGHLMLARYRAGRQAEALAAYEEARGLLAEELGIDPSPELRRLHEQILQQDPALELRGQPLRGYRLLERIGEGAFGVVHRALQPQVGREVAIKSIHPELANDPEFVRRFEREAQLVARLEHPHVVPLYDYWREPDAAYLVMRFLRGGSLRARLEEGGGLAADEVATLLDQVADALAAAHHQGVVHRDVKPENVLLDEDGRAYLTDFGIAKDLEESRTTRSGALGTPAYLSPEQIRGEPVTPSTDLYALGLLLYEALTGRHPFPDGSLAALMQQHLSDPVPSVLPIRPELSSGVDGVIARATAKDPSLRFADAPALAAAFRAALGTYATAPSRMPALRVANPFKGLRPFDEADAPDFFGRDALVARLLARLDEEVAGSRLLAVVGPSGSGKSSVVSAGLLPALRGGALDGSSGWFYAEMTPGAHPIEELESALLRVAIDPPASLIEQLERDELGLLRATKRILPDDGSELLLVIDQLEELFTLTEDERVRSHVLASVAAAVADPNSRLRVLATLRADFYDRPLLYPAFGELLGARTEAVTPLAPDELERAIAGPSERVGVAPEPALLAEMVADVADEPGALPLLQYALTELFDRREDRTMTLAAYHEIGGISGALAKRADELFENFDEAGRRACRQLFLHLVALGEGTEDTRRRVARTELDTLEVDRGAMDQVIDAFGRHRLLSFDRDPLTRGPTVELAHEALLRVWGRLRAWIDEARDDVRAQHRLGTSALEWELSDREPSFLLSGARLAQFESWSGTSELALARREREYLKESLDRRHAEEKAERGRIERERALERRSVRRMRGLVGVLAVAALVAGTLTAVATNQRNEAEQARLETRARELAAAANANLDVDPELAILLAIEAVETTRAVDGTVLKEANDALHRAVIATRTIVTIPNTATQLDFDPRSGSIVTAMPDGRLVIRDPETGTDLRSFGLTEAMITGLDVRYDGRAVATSREDGSVQIWDMRSGDAILEVPPTGVPSLGVEFAPRGDTFATIDREGTVVLRNAPDGAERWRTTVWSEDPEFPFGEMLAFAPHGGRLAVASAGPVEMRDGFRSATVLDTTDGRTALAIGPVGFPPHGVAFSPDGRLVATAEADGAVILWDPLTGTRRLTVSPSVGTSNAHDVDFSPDGTRLATGELSGVVRVWELESTGAREILTLGGHSTAIKDVAFNEDGSLLASGSDDGTTRIWDLTPGGSREVFTAVGPFFIGDVAFDPSGRTLYASTSPDGTVGVWDLRTRTLAAELHHPNVFGIDLDAMGSTVATASLDRTVKVWDARAGSERMSFTAAECAPDVGLCSVFDVRISADGRLLATGAADGTARIYDLRSGREQLRLEAHTDNVFGIDLSPSGSVLATASWDGTAKLWNVENGDLIATLDDRDAQVTSVAFSPDGGLIATGGFDGGVNVFETSGWRQVQRLQARGSVFTVAFSPDGRYLVSGGDFVRIWDVESGHEVGTIPGTAVRVTYSPDGAELATSENQGGPIRVWLLDVDRLVELARHRLTRAFTAQECNQYQIDPCPEAG